MYKIMLAAIFILVTLTQSWSQNLPFRGGNGDGYADVTYTTPATTIPALYRGGAADGYAESSYSPSTVLSIYRGGIADGYAYLTYSSPVAIAMYDGGQGDGYDMEQLCQTYYWSGLAGPSWNNANNWNSGRVPCYCNPVIIQDTVQTFPIVGAGTLLVGGTHDTGTYNCQRIKIEPGAMLTTWVNCYIENYDQILVRGDLLVRNPSPLALQNFGEVRIRNNGLMRLGD